MLKIYFFLQKNMSPGVTKYISGDEIEWWLNSPEVLCKKISLCQVWKRPTKKWEHVSAYRNLFLLNTIEPMIQKIHHVIAKYKVLKL